MDLRVITKQLTDIVQSEILGSISVLNEICDLITPHLQTHVMLIDHENNVLWSDMPHTANAILKYSNKQKSCVQIEKDIFTIIPLIAQNENLGAIILQKEFLNANEEILIDVSIIILSIILLQMKNETLFEESRDLSAAKSAIGTLTYSELVAILYVFQELQENDSGMVVASKIAEQKGVTRSVIVNALRKFESAGLIEARSLGMKGTYIRVLNKYLIEELNKLESV